MLKYIYYKERDIIMKKQSRNTQLILSLIPFVIALSLLVFMFLNAVVLKKMVTYGQHWGKCLVLDKQAFSVILSLSLIYYLFFPIYYPLLLTVSIVILGILKKDKLASILAIVLTVSFVLSTVGLFIIPSSTNLYTVTGIGTLFNSLAELGYQLSITSIIAAILSIIAALVSLGQIARGFIKK